MHLTDTIEPLANMLLHIAQCQPHELAVAIIDSGINKRMLDLAELKRLARSVGGRLQAVIEDCDGGADSGIETVIRVRLAQHVIRQWMPAPNGGPGSSTRSQLTHADAKKRGRPEGRPRSVH